MLYTKRPIATMIGLVLFISRMMMMKVAATREIESVVCGVLLATLLSTALFLQLNNNFSLLNESEH